MRKIIPPRTQQTTRTRPESLVSVPHTSSSSSQRTQNFWASSNIHSSHFNLFTHHSYKKPDSGSIFLTSKANVLTPRRDSSSNILARKYSEPIMTERPSTTFDKTDYKTFLQKESPLTLRENNSRFYQRMKKMEDDQKISSNRLIWESYGLAKSAKKQIIYPFKQSNQEKEYKEKEPNREKESFESLNSYGLQKKFQIKTKEDRKPIEDFFVKSTYKNVENEFQKRIELEKPKMLVESAQESQNDLFERHLKLGKKFKVKTFLTQKDEMRLHSRAGGDSFREVNKRLVVPRLYEKIENMKKRIVLVIENIYLNDCKNKNTLKYCYLQLPVLEKTPVISSSIIENEFQEIVRVLKEKFNLNTRELFIFLKNGKEIKSHYEIPSTEKTILISGNRIFQGLNHLLQGKRKIKGFLLMRTIYDLERPLMGQEVPEKQPISIEQHIKENYTDVVNEVIDILGETGENCSHDLEKINKIYKKKKEIIAIEGERVKKNEGRLNFKNKEDFFDNEKSGIPLIYSKKFDDVCHICDLYEKNNQEIEFEKLEREDSDEGEGGQMQELENVRNLEEKEMRKMANYLDYLLEKWNNPKKKVKLKEDIEESESKQEDTIMIDYGGEDEEKKERNFIEENQGKYETKRGYIQKLCKQNKEIFLQNIPKLLKRTNFTRRELHSIYILYKALQEVTSQRYDKYNLDEGLDYYTFRNGIYQVFVQSEGLAKMIFNTIDFNYSGFLNWEEFLNLMVIIKAKTLREKIDLFIKIADEDGNGMLSQTEIFNLCKICLSKFISEQENDHFLDDLCDYFTKLIFGAVNIDIEDEIPLQTIKEAILSGNEESDLLAMFCGADM